MSLTLRTRLVILLLAFSLAPSLGAGLLMASTRHQDAQIALSARVAGAAQTADVELRGDFERFRQILLTSAQNPSLVEILRDPEHASQYKQSVDRTLLNLTSMFPGMIDEACLIDPHGVERGRVVRGEIAPDDDLSSEESDTPFFSPTLGLHQGEVYYQRPYLSPDTNRWVVSASTPLYADGDAVGILHFEVPLAFYYRGLRGPLPPDALLVILGPDGKVYLRSDDPEPTDEPLSRLDDVTGGPSTVHRHIGGAVHLHDPEPSEGGFINWTVDGRPYHVHQQTIEPGTGLQLTILVGLPELPGFAAELGPFLLPLFLGMVIVLLIAMVVASLLTRSFQASPGFGQHRPAGRERQTSSWFILLVALSMALGAAVSVAMLHQGAIQHREAQTALARIDGLTSQLDDLGQPSDSSDEASIPSQHLRSVAAQLASAIQELDGLESGGTVPDRLIAVSRQYQSDVAELQALRASGRLDEARVWQRQRVIPGREALRAATNDAAAIHGAAARRAEIAAVAGSAIVLVLAAVVMSLLFWRVERARRALVATEELALRRSEERFRSLVGNASDVIVILDGDGVLRYQSPAAERIWGYPSDGLVGLGIDELYHPEDASSALDLVIRALDNPTENVSAELRVKLSDGSWRNFEVIANNLLDVSGVEGIVATFRDITERKSFEKRLTDLAFHDSLTNLPNRALFMDCLQRALARAQRSGDLVGVIFVDMDNFKVINDSLGHEAGDALLVAIADRLRTGVRASDLVARLGGDEFTVLLEGVHDEDEAARLVERLESVVQAPVTIAGRELRPGVSMGLATSQNGRTAAEAILHQADLAMYAAKSAGKRQYAVYDAGMEDSAGERLALEHDLRRALEQGELTLHYQPIVALATGEIVEVEALVRWQHPSRGMVSPAEFIPFAEETGLIVPLGRWILEEACHQARAWQSDHPDSPVLALSVNLSARQLAHPSFLDDLARVLRESGLSPQTLMLELTESAILRDTEIVIERLAEIKKLGVRLAIDDFGTGYSSLSHLQRFPVDRLKIDRSFVAGLGKTHNDTAIVRGVTALAKSLGLSVTAEGIEASEQLRQLEAIGCEHGQGYLFARPAPSHVIWDLLDRGARLRATSHLEDHAVA